ncbi:Uma2 family endonuclease [Emticicia sp. W12TSBA100-4]|uniref:Uma2 family endonuclease n=1 Tax=Emticicia sp. W12TSBA100-4 TaxID=3160965 RepID=UPI0033065F6F
MNAIATHSRYKLGAKKVEKRIPQPKLLTYEDYVKLTPPNSGNYELLNGQIIFKQTPKPSHQTTRTLLSIYLGNFIIQNKLGELYTAPLDVHFTEYDTLQPNLLFITKERLNIIGENKIEGSPDLVVEILSPSNDNSDAERRPMSYKKHIYEITGVKEYWLINVEKQSLTLYKQVDNELRWQRDIQKNEVLTSEIIKGFELELNKIFE